MRKVSVAELGNILPEKGCTFSLLPATGRREKDIYRVLNKSQKLASVLPWQVRACLSVLLNAVGDVQFPAHDGEAKTLDRRLDIFDSISLGLGDAYYMYVVARIESISPELKLQLNCPRCTEKSQYTLDLTKLMVEVGDGPTQTKVDLPIAVKIGGKEFTKATVSGMKFRPHPDLLDSIADAKLTSVAEMTKLEGYDFPLSAEMIQDWPMSVIKILYDKSSEITPGISELLRFKCSGCGNDNPYTINWEYAGFFM